MANIHVNRGQTNLGVFSEEEIRDGIRGGRFIGTDLGWREGMASWQMLSQFPEFAADFTGTATAAGAAVIPTLATATAPIERTGLPWDRREQLGFFPAFFETLKLVLLNPVVAFSSMKTEGGLAGPLIYAVVGGSAGFIVYFLFSMAMGSLGVLADRRALAGLAGMGAGGIILIIFIPVFLAIGLFVGAAILHLCLMLVGGAKKSFEATFRVLCFCAGSTYPLMIVPFCGGLVAGVWNIVLEIIGLARTHETDTGRAALAVFLPLIVCCGGGFLIVILCGGLAALTGNHH